MIYNLKSSLVLGHLPIFSLGVADKFDENISLTSSCASFIRNVCPI